MEDLLDRPLSPSDSPPRRRSFSNLFHALNTGRPESRRNNDPRRDDAFRQSGECQALVPSARDFSALNSPYTSQSFPKPALANFARPSYNTAAMDRGDILQRDPRIYPLAASVTPSPLSIPSSFSSGSSYFPSEESLHKVCGDVTRARCSGDERNTDTK
jgi:hypothetical protein